MSVSFPKLCRQALSLAVLALLVALVTAGVAAAQQRPAGDRRSPDTKDAAAASDTLDPAIAAALASHRAAATTSAAHPSPDTLDGPIARAIAAHRAAPTPFDLRSPDTRELEASTATVDLRSPDTRDALGSEARQLQTSSATRPNSTVTRTVLAITAAGAALILLAGFGTATRRSRGKRGQSISPA